MSRMALWTAALAVCLSAMVGNAVNGQDKPLERKDLDQRVYVVLRDVINTGADLYNGIPEKSLLPDPGACYQLYHGALLALRPMLDHHADLQKAIDGGIAKANNEKDSRRRAFILRAVIDEVRTATKGKEAAAATLWDQLGGEKKVAKIVDDFVAAAAADPKVNFYRDGKFKDKVDAAKLKKHLVDMISSVSGGPHKYTGRGMKEVHAGMGISSEEFDATVAHLKKALEKNEVKAEDADLVLKAVISTKKDIVEPGKPMEKAPDDKKPKAVKVDGVVILDGKPLANATITFMAADDAKKTHAAKTDATGQYQVKDLPLGKYKVTISLTSPKDDKKPAAELLPAKYNTKTTLTFEALTDSNGDFKLDSK